MAKAYPKTKSGSRANRSNKTKGAPKNLGPRGGSGKPGTKAKSIATKNASSATGRGDLQGNKGKQVAKATKAKAKRKMKANVKAAKPSGVTKAAKNIARAGKLARGTTAVGAAMLAADAIKSENEKVKKVKGRPKTKGQMGRKKK